MKLGHNFQYQNVFSRFNNGPYRTMSSGAVSHVPRSVLFLRALTRILQTGVQDSHLAKSRSPTGKIGSPTPKKLESHQFVHTVYLFHFSRK